MSRKRRKFRNEKLTEELEAAYAAKEAKIVEEVMLCTPTTYFRLGREDKGEWEDISMIADPPEDEEVSTICLGNYVDLIDHPITIGGEELPRGVVLIVGAPEAGKTFALESIRDTLTAMKKKWVAYRYREPIEPGRYSRKHKKLNDLQLLETLARFMVMPNHEAEVFFLDSISAFLFRQWPTWNTGKFGLNSGMGFWITDLHDALVDWGKTLITPVNPNSAVDTIVDSFYQFCRGRAGGVIQLETAQSGFYSYRATTGRRVFADYQDLLKGMPILSTGPNPSDAQYSMNKDKFL